MSRPTEAYIYQITCTATGDCYIGSTSTQFASRMKSHYSSLRRGNHASINLQAAWDLHGAQAFTDQVIERCPHETRYIREQFYLDSLLPKLNVSPIASGHPQTEQTKVKIGQASKDWWAANDQTPAQRIAMAESLKLARAKTKANKPGWIPTHRLGVKDSPETIEKRRQTRLKSSATRIKRCWITDGELEQQIEMLATIPEGWRRGRQPKIGEVGKSRVGEKRSDEARAKMSAAHKRRYAEMVKCELPL